MNRIVLRGRDRAALVDRRTGDVEHAAHHRVADRHRDRRAAVGDAVAALEAFGGGHRDRPHTAVAEVLLDFERQGHRLLLDGVFNRERVVDRGQRVGKLDVHHRTVDLNDCARIHIGAFCQFA